MLKNKTLERLLRLLITLIGAGVGALGAALLAPLLLRLYPDVFNHLTMHISVYVVLCAAGALLLAVMEKRAGKKLFDQDVYVSVAGGLELSDPAADLAVCMAVASSLDNFQLSQTLCVMGEIGLCGEVRPIAQA